MTTILHRLASRKLIHPPQFVVNGSQYLTIMGSDAYGVSSNTSDIDVYGFCIPDKEMVFPHLSGEIQGFGTQIQRFQQYQEHHIKDTSNAKEYDFNIFNIVKYFQLCMENNPNMIDSLFTPDRCVLFASNIGQLVRDNKTLFLHKGSYHKFKGYGYSQMNKSKPLAVRKNEKRAQDIETFGYDLKSAYHVVRLINEAEQILMTGTIDLEQNREQLKSVRRGEWTYQQIEEYFVNKEASLEELYVTSKLQNKPDELKIKNLLLACLEEHFGSLDALVTRDNAMPSLIKEMEQLMARYR